MRPAGGCWFSTMNLNFRRGVRSVSALPPKADMDQQGRDVCFVPKPDAQPFIRSPCHHARWARFHDPIPKTNSISRLAMRHGLGCSAVNCIAAHQIQTHFFDDSGVLLEKDRIHVVTDLGLHSALGAIWACHAGTILLERP